MDLGPYISRGPWALHSPLTTAQLCQSTLTSRSGFYTLLPLNSPIFILGLKPTSSCVEHGSSPLQCGPVLLLYIGQCAGPIKDSAPATPYLLSLLIFPFFFFFQLCGSFPPELDGSKHDYVLNKPISLSSLVHSYIILLSSLVVGMGSHWSMCMWLGVA